MSVTEMTDAIVSYSKDLDTSYASLKPKDALKTRLQWNSLRPPVNLYTPASSNFEVELSTQGVINPSECFCTYWCAATDANEVPVGNNVAANAYTRQVELLDSSSPFRRIDLVANDILIDSITDKSMIDSLTFAFVGDDYMQSVALETNLYAPSSVRKYYEGGRLTNQDVIGSTPIIDYSTNAAPESTTAVGAAFNQANLQGIVDELDNALARSAPRYTKLHESGVNNLLGLSLVPNTEADPGNANYRIGVGVTNGNYYRLSLAGFFKVARELILLPTMKIKLVFWLQNFSSTYYAAGANLPTQYLIRDFQLHVKKLELPSEMKQSKIEKLWMGDSDPMQRSFYRYESYLIKQQTINNDETNIYVNHNVNLPNVKAIFVVFRPQNDINNLAISDKKNCFVFPCNANPTSTSATYQFQIDGVQYPDDQVTVGPKQTARAFDMTAQAFDAIDNYDGGTQIISASMLERGNFVLGLRLKGYDDLAPSRWVGRLEFFFNIGQGRQTGAVYTCQTIVVYDTELSMGASVVDVKPLPQPGATS